IIAVTPPASWVMSVWHGGTIELAEFTPPGQTGGKYVDLLGYSVLPKLAGTTPMTQAEAPAVERRNKRKTCRQVVLRERQHRAGWYADQLLCIGRKGDPNRDRVILSFVIQRVGDQGVFRVWREWRGTPVELTAMLKARTGLTLAPVVGQRVDEAALDQAFAALAPIFTPDIARSEICDLKAPVACRAFRDALPPEATARLRGTFIAGFYGKGLRLLPEEEFRQRFHITTPDDGGPNRVFVIVEPKDLDWSDAAAVDRMAFTVGTGVVSDGGSLVASDPTGRMSAAQQAEVRVHVLMTGRRLWREGYPPDVIAFRIPPSE
ncbi:MAG: hypothetical protein ABI655_03630, partial [Phenylobacterium sp.]